MEKKFQIFISSTYEDLKEERAKLVATILKDYHFPIGADSVLSRISDQGTGYKSLQ